MMKENRGITLIALMITVVLIFIIVSVSVNVSYNVLNDTKDRNSETELGTVRQAVTEQYLTAVAVKKLKVLATENQVELWVGERIEDSSNIALPRTLIEDNNARKFYEKISNYTPNYQEEYYYRLDPTDLQKIGISDSKSTYIVNYATAEVYNETKKTYTDATLIYLPEAASKTKDTDTEDLISFNDW